MVFECLYEEHEYWPSKGVLRPGWVCSRCRNIKKHGGQAYSSLLQWLMNMITRALLVSAVRF